MENYTVDYFIKKFEAIPDRLWLIGDQGSGEAHCALGHCKNDSGVYGCSARSNSKEASALIDLFEKNGFYSIQYGETQNGGWVVAEINNGVHPLFQQPTPKQRILAVLYDIKSKQQPEVKERIVYVSIDSAVKEISKSLCEN